MSSDLPLQTPGNQPEEVIPATDKGEPVIVQNRNSSHPVLLVCEHAGTAIPSSLGNLGLSREQLASHIAWDPGAGELTGQLATALNAAAVSQRYSRLVYDCNRPPHSPDAMRTISDGVAIPGNIDISPQQRQWRTHNIYVPFHDTIASILDERTRANIEPLLVTIHSFTPLFAGQHRDVEIGILHDRDDRLANFILARKQLLGNHDIRRNEPYGPADGVCHSLQKHAISRNIPNVMIEIRNDLLTGARQAGEWADRLSAVLKEAANSNGWRGQPDKN